MLKIILIKSKNKNQKEKNTKTIVTIGTFDGVHLGHQKIINQLVNTAKKDNLRSVVLTFFPHPRMVLQKDIDLKLINTLKERTHHIKQLGVNDIITKKFTEAFSRLSAHDFVNDILVNELDIKKIIIGYDHRFGRNRNANITHLKAYSEMYDFDVIEIPAQQVNDVAISSTKIRNALLEGEIKLANSFLGYNFAFSGKVIKGKGIGRQIHFPTANMKIEESYKLMPKNGVYIVCCHHKKKILKGMMNIGLRPTVSNSETLSVEVHFFNFNASLYNKILEIQVLERLREEIKFDSLKVLKKQLKKDKKKTLNYFKAKT